MGCCETRDKKIKENTLLTLKDGPSLKTDIEELALPEINSITVPYVQELFKYIQSILLSPEWVEAIKDHEFSADKMKGSPYNKTSLVTRLAIDFDTYVPLNLILDLFFIPKKRLSWDTCLKNFEIVEDKNFLPVTHSMIKVMFYSSELVEQVFMFYQGDDAYFINYSTQHDLVPVKKELTRAEKHFGLVKIGEQCGKTKITFITQVDPKSKMEIMASSVGIIQQKMWALSLKKKVLKIMKADKIVN